MTDFSITNPLINSGPFAAPQQPPKPAAANRSQENHHADAEGRLHIACAEMESLFIYHLLEKMRTTIEKTDLFGGGRTEKMYTSMLDGEIAKDLAAAGGIGLAEVLQQQLDRVVNAQNNSEDNS